METRPDVAHSTASRRKSVGTMTPTTRALLGCAGLACSRRSRSLLSAVLRGSPGRMPTRFHRHARRRAKLVDSSRRRG